MNTEKIYKQAKDEHVAGVIVYASAEDVMGQESIVAYKDDAKTERFTVAELKDAFIKGCVIDADGVYLIKPVQYIFGNESGLEMAGLIGYYNLSQEGGDICELLQVITWDGDLPEIPENPDDQE